MSTASAQAGANTAKTAYDFTFESLAGKPMPLAQYKGKALLVVNTASRCGFTPQYKGLEELYEKYKDKGLAVIGVPSNDFGAQEPGSAAEIQQFCQLNYGVTFPMAAKQVVSGAGASPFYQWLRASLGADSEPKWNFHKYLIDASGRPAAYFGSKMAPESEALTSAIDKLLPKK